MVGQYRIGHLHDTDEAQTKRHTLCLDTSACVVCRLVSHAHSTFAEGLRLLVVPGAAWDTVEAGNALEQATAACVEQLRKQKVSLSLAGCVLYFFHCLLQML